MTFDSLKRISGGDKESEVGWPERQVLTNWQTLAQRKYNDAS